MGNLGAWQSPFPIRLGGGAHERADRILSEIRASVPGLLSNDDNKLNMAEDIAAARLIRMADRFIDRRINQRDPMLLSEEMVERWEAILAIVPEHNARLYDRRRAIAARQAHNAETLSGTTERMVEYAFAPWPTRIVYTSLAQAVMRWPGGTTSTSMPWTSTVAHLAIEYVVDEHATQDDIDKRIAACSAALDDFLPAWTTFDFSQTPSFGATALQFGFYLDRPNLDQAVFSE